MTSPTERNRFEKQVQKINLSLMIFYNKKEGYAEYFLYILRHECNWFLSNQKKCLTTARSEIKNKA